MIIRKTQRHYGKESMKLFIKKAGKTNNPSFLRINQKSLTNKRWLNTLISFSLPLVKIFKKPFLLLEKIMKYLKTPNKSNFLIKPIKPQEICDIIKTLKNSKSTGPNSIPTKILKIIKKSISVPLSTLINNSVTNGTFPNVCKKAKIVPVFKNESSLPCNN